LLEYRRAENRPWVAAFVQKYFKLAGRPAEQTINDVEEYFETLVYDEDISFAVCRVCLERAFKERGAEHLHAVLERAKNYALEAG
jgi:hypothetical protein